MNPPANWYPDPTGRHGQRYWDGEQWTEHVFTDGVQDVDPLEQAAPATEGAATAEQAAARDESVGGGTAASEAGDRDVQDEAGVRDAGDEGAGEGHPGEDGTGTNETDTDETGTDEAASAAGLFADAGDGDAWTLPGDDAAADAQDDTVAPDMEAEDVVASLDEVSDETPSEVAAAVPESEEEAAAEAHASPPAGDMSDAFVLAPETASRIVKRRAPEDTGTPEEEQAPATAPAADATEPPAGEAPDQSPPSTGAIDAPPPTAPASPPPTDAAAAASPTDGGELGITGDLLGGAFAERSEAGPVALQNTRLLRCSVTPGAAVVSRQGTMVAYQGDVSFDRQGAGGVTRALKRAATGEGLAMMRAEGSGDVFFADGAQHVFLLELAGGPGLSVNGRNVLAFSAALQWDIERVKGASLLAGGLFNTTFTGNGWVALVSDGEPVVLHTDEAPTHVDVNALVAWSAGLSTRIVNSVTAKSLVGLGSGEAFQMAFDGAGIVIVQPSEGPMGGAAAS